MPSKALTHSAHAYPSSLVVYAQLSGTRTILLRLLIDTGATYTMIPLKAAMAIGYDPATALTRIPLVTVSAVEYAPLIALPSLKCLGHEFRHLKVACHDLPPQSAVDGLLGLDALTHMPPFRTWLDHIQPYLIKP